MDTQKGDEDENEAFESIAPEKDNPVQREFEIGHIGNQELKKDERARDESRHSTPGNHKPSQRKF
ncbi:hypothetical protein [Flavobacterium sp. JAS]|uniref:hypothetical protein n=1 Tax=Flavobacterium sp. JAS TaxID=2897329 RepID=UPI001E607C45|nr:hypothetical protein [Flavobacterium sp. JAS]MCD0469907.1 hypothetical protein [Flavobacterium sp. JAS]